jgi:tRNA(Ile)-lysidine synthase
MTMGDAIAGGEFEELLARCTFPPPGSALVCGVSGGADSLALLVLGVAAGCRVTAVHVDHSLRPGSAQEAEPIAALAGRLGVSFRSETVTVGPGHGVLGPDAALGHTADDRAETVLVNLLRGAGPDGLASIRPGPRHPILALRRHETESVCASLGLVPFVDPTNTDPDFVRNRIRHEVLPLLADISTRDPVPVLDRQASLFADIADHLRDEADALDPSDSRVLAAAPVAVARVAIREWLRIGAEDLHPPDSATVERVLSVARNESLATDIGRGRRVERSGGVLRIVPAPTD